MHMIIILLLLLLLLKTTYIPVGDGCLRTTVTPFGKVAQRVFSPPAVGECDAKDRQQAKKQTAGTIHLYINYAKLYTDSILLSTGHSSTTQKTKQNQQFFIVFFFYRLTVV